ncbi:MULTISPECIES: hypothetical protein [Rhodococcus]|uniref:hypothetical protein n=1 Tax=Rhodococcus TaxID=1827 RepID=UPI0004AEEB1A|nr:MULTISPECIES: hypothetical protein [Rhodococcus]WAM13667.1 hypothetical protein OYT95_30190 [Rhodococcus sp. JS3073]
MAQRAGVHIATHVRGAASGRQLVGDLDVDFLFGHSAEEMVGEHVSSVLENCD